MKSPTTKDQARLKLKLRLRSLHLGPRLWNLPQLLIHILQKPAQRFCHRPNQESPTMKSRKLTVTPAMMSWVPPAVLQVMLQVAQRRAERAKIARRKIGSKAT